MRLPRSGNFYFTLLLMMFLLLLLGTALTYPDRAALVPLAVGIPTVLLIILELARDQSRTLSRFLETKHFGGKKPAGKDNAEETTKNSRQEITAILIIIGYVALIMAVGFHPAIPVFVMFYCLVFVKTAWWKALALAAGTWAFIYLVFSIFLEVRLPWGFIF